MRYPIYFTVLYCSVCTTGVMGSSLDPMHEHQNDESDKKHVLIHAASAPVPPPMVRHISIQTDDSAVLHHRSPSSVSNPDGHKRHPSRKKISLDFVTNDPALTNGGPAIVYGEIQKTTHHRKTSSRMGNQPVCIPPSDDGITTARKASALEGLGKAIGAILEGVLDKK